MIVDIHVHAFPDALAKMVIPKLESISKNRTFINGTIGALQTSMQAANIGLSVVQPVASSAAQVASCNQFAQSINESCSEVISFGAMHPDFEDYKAELARLKAAGFRGIKLHPNYQAMYFDDIRYQRILDAASALDLIVLVHAGLDVGLPDPIYLTPQIAKRVIREVQPTKLILAHMGGWQIWDEVLDTLAGENAYLDTAFCLGELNYFEDLPPDVPRYSQLTKEHFLKMVEAFGADKILFGSDSPWSDQAGSVGCIEALPLTPAQKRLILGENAQQLLGLK